MSGAGLGIAAFRAYVRRAALRRVNNKHVEPIRTWNIVKGDTVTVLTGRDKGKVGKVKQVLRKKNRLVIAGVNVRRRVFRSMASAATQLKPVESPIQYSNVNLVDPATNKPTRIAIRYTETGERVRLAKRSGTIIPLPEEMKSNRSLKPPTPGPKDTAAEVVSKVTYSPPAELLPYLQRTSGKLWLIHGKGRSKAQRAGAAAAAQAAGVQPTRVAGRAGDELAAVVPSVLRTVRMRKHDRNRLRRKWEKGQDRIKISNRVARLLHQDALLQAATAGSGKGSGAAGDASGAASSSGGSSGQAQAVAAAAFVVLAAPQEEQDGQQGAWAGLGRVNTRLAAPGRPREEQMA